MRTNIALLFGIVALLLISAGAYLYLSQETEVTFEEINSSYSVEYGSLLLEKEIKIDENNNIEVLKLSAPESVENFFILTAVPKHLAESTAEVDVSTNGKKIVINEDPVFRFENKNLPDAVDVELSIGKGSNEFATISGVFPKHIIDGFTADELEEFYDKFAEFGDYELNFREAEEIEKTLAERLIEASYISLGGLDSLDVISFEEDGEEHSLGYDEFMDAFDETLAQAEEIAEEAVRMRIYTERGGVKIEILTNPQLFGTLDLELYIAEYDEAEETVYPLGEPIREFLSLAGGVKKTVVVSTETLGDEIDYELEDGEYYFVLFCGDEFVTWSEAVILNFGEEWERAIRRSEQIKLRDKALREFKVPSEIRLRVSKTKKTATFESYFIIGDATDVEYTCENYDCPAPLLNSVLVNGKRYSETNNPGLTIGFVDEDGDGSELEGTPYKIKISVNYDEVEAGKRQILFGYPVTATPRAKIKLIIEKTEEEETGRIFFNKNLLDSDSAWKSAINNYSSEKGWKAVAFEPSEKAPDKIFTGRPKEILYLDDGGDYIVNVILHKVNWRFNQSGTEITQPPSIEISFEGENRKKLLRTDLCGRDELELDESEIYLFCGGQFEVRYYDYDAKKIVESEPYTGNVEGKFVLEVRYPDPNSEETKTEDIYLSNIDWGDSTSKLRILNAKKFKKLVMEEYSNSEFEYMLILDSVPKSGEYLMPQLWIFETQDLGEVLYEFEDESELGYVAIELMGVDWKFNSDSTEIVGDPTIKINFGKFDGFGTEIICVTRELGVGDTDSFCDGQFEARYVDYKIDKLSDAPAGSDEEVPYINNAEGIFEIEVRFRKNPEDEEYTTVTVELVEIYSSDQLDGTEEAATIPAVVMFERFSEQIDPELKDFKIPEDRKYWFNEFVLLTYYGDVDGDYLQDIAIGRLNFSSVNEFLIWQKVQKYENKKEQISVFEEDPILAHSRAFVLKRYKDSFLFSGLEYEILEELENVETPDSEQQVLVYLNPNPEEINELMVEPGLFVINAHGSEGRFATRADNIWVKLSRIYGEFGSPGENTVRRLLNIDLDSAPSWQYTGSSDYHHENIPKLLKNHPIIFESSCSTAKQLGHAFIKQGAKLYVGNEAVSGIFGRIFPVNISKKDISYGELVRMYNRYYLKKNIDSKSAIGFGRIPKIVIGDPSTKMTKITPSQENILNVTLGNNRIIINVTGKKYVDDYHTINLMAVEDWVVMEVEPKKGGKNFILLSDLDAEKFRDIIRSDEFGGGEIWDYSEGSEGVPTVAPTKPNELRVFGEDWPEGITFKMDEGGERVIIGNVSDLQPAT